MVKAVDYENDYEIEGETVGDLLQQFDGGDDYAIYRDGFIDVYDADVSDEDADADDDGSLAYLHMEVID